MRWFRSLPLRVRLTAWYVGILAAVLLVFTAGTATVLYFQLFHQLTRFAIQDVETVEGLLFFQPDGHLALNENYHNHPQSRQVLERLLEVLSLDGTVLYRNERLGHNFLGGPPFPGEGLGGYSERTVHFPNGTRILLVSRRHSIQEVPVLIRLGYEQGAIRERIEEFLTASATALPVLLALAGLLGHQLARRLLSPLALMAQQAEQMTADQLNQRLPVGNPADELGHLARVFNSLLDRLQRSFEQLRRFTADASHELRTPLAAIRSVGEVSLQHNRTPAEYQDTIGSMLEEVTRLTKLVENLLTISRADAGQMDLHLTTFSLGELVRETVGFVEVLAEERQQTITLRGEQDFPVRGDRLLLRQALLNVLHNAVKYSPVGGRIAVSVTEDGPGRVVVKIRDNGPGIPREHQDKIFDRFYRVDAARARETGGAGLGLSIAQWAIAVQGGHLRLEDGEEGATFALDLPRAELVPVVS